MRRGASGSSRRGDPLEDGERKRGFSAAILRMTRRNSTRSSRTVSDSSNESDYERIKQVKWTAGALSQLPDTMANEIFSLAARLNTMWGNKSAGSRSSDRSSRSRQSSEESDWGADYSGSGVGAGVTMWGKSKRSLMGLGESTASRRALFKSQSSFGSSFASFRDFDLGESDENDAASISEPRRTSATSRASKGSTSFRRSSKRKQSRTAQLKAKAHSFIKAAYLNTSTKSVTSAPDVVLLKPDATIHSLPKIVFRKIWEFVGPLHHWSFEEAHKEQKRLGFLRPAAQWILMSADIPIETVFGLPDGVPPKTASEEIEAKLCANTAVGHLYFHWAKIYGDHGAMLGRVLTQNNAIHSLSVWLDGETSSFEALIAGLEHNVGLKALDLTGSAAAVGASGNALLHELLSLKNLEHLNLHSCQLSAPSLMSLSRGIRESNSLVSLNLSQNKNMSKPVGEKVFAAIAESRSLRSLNVSDCKLGEDAGAALTTLARYHATLEAIDMSYNPGVCTPFVSEALVKTISKSRHLKSLKMGGIFWPEVSISAFALAVGDSISIEEFYCEGDCGFENFKPALLKTRVLKRLALGGNMTLSSALALCDALKVNDSLQVLRIRELELGEEFGEALIDVLRVNSSLRKIDARKNGCSNLIPQMDADELARCKF